MEAVSKIYLKSRFLYVRYQKLKIYSQLLINIFKKTDNRN